MFMKSLQASHTQLIRFKGLFFTKTNRVWFCF